MANFFSEIEEEILFNDDLMFDELKIKEYIFGEIDLDLQIKYSLIDSNDIDLFLASLKNAEIQMGVLVCKESRNLEKYELNSKIKTILLSKGIQIKERIIEKDINLNPVLILKLNELTEIVTFQIRAVVRGIYKE